MKQNKHTHIYLLLFLVMCTGAVYSANNWTATLDSSRITQGEGSGILTITINNDINSDRAVDNKLTFYLDKTYYNFSGATSVPPGWQIRLVKEDEIIFEATGSGIAAGAGETFDIMVTGPDGGIIPNSSGDTTDSELINIEHPGFPDIDASGYTWERKGLKVVLDAVPESLGIDQTITLTAYVTNRTAGAVTGITCSGPVLTGTGSATLTTGPSPSSIDLASGETKTIQWTYTSSAEGDIIFTTHASGTGVTSLSSGSGTLVSGGFTCLVSVDKTQIVSGEDVTVTMTLSNNGDTSLGSVIPDSDLVNTGTASASKTSGPSPSSIASLAPGASADIVYVYNITGSTGRTYQFEGKASANGPVASNTDSSDQGSLCEFSASVSPYVLSSGASNVTVTWEIFNNSSSQLDKVIFDPFPGWGVSGVTPHANWDFNPDPMVTYPDTITFSAGTRIDPGDSGTFSITFSSVPTVTSDTDYNFRIELEGPGLKPTNINTTLTVTAYEISLSHSPAGPLDADGTSQYTMTALLTQGGSPVQDTLVSFSATAGSLSSGTAATNSSGEALVTLTAPVSSTDTSSTVTASCSTASAQDTVSFTGVTGPNLQYIGGTLNTTTGGEPYPDPPTADIGKAQGTSQSFCVNVINQGDEAVTVGTASTLEFTDGTCTYSANLTKATFVDIGAQGTLYFGSALIDASFSEGNFQGTLTLEGDTPAAAPSGPKPRIGAPITPQTRSISDTINIFTPTYVKLAHLEAQGMDGAVKILWTTVIEVNNLGFHIYRRVKGTSAYTRITAELILGRYDSAQSADYEFIDTDAENGTVYEYILEDWDVSNVKTVHGPVAALPDAEDPWGEVWDKGWDPDGHRQQDDIQPSAAVPDIFTVTGPEQGIIEVRALIPEPELTETAANGRAYTKVSLDRASLLDTQGEPAVPVLAAAVEIPPGMTVSAEIISTDRETDAGYPVIPAAERYAEYTGAVRSVEQGSVSEGPVYVRDEWFPETVFSIEDLGMQRDRHLIAVRLYPVRTNPVSGSLDIYSEIRLKLTLEESPKPLLAAGAAGTGNPPEGIQPLLKAGVASAGLYRITYSDLADQGWFPLDPRNLSLYDSGTETALTVHGEDDGSFDPGDFIEFYGVSRVTQYADTNIYRLSETTEPGLRMQTFDAAPSGTDLSAVSREVTVHREQDTVYSGTCPAQEGADRWFWALAYTSPADFTFSLDAVDTGYGGLCTVTVNMHGLTWDDTVDPDHHVVIALNGTQIGEIKWDGKTPCTFSAEQNHTLLNSGSNTVTLTLPQDTGTVNDAVYVDSIDIAYRRLWQASEGRFHTELSGPGRATVDGFASSSIRVFDITDPELPAVGENAVITEESPGSWSITFKAGTGDRSYLLITDSALRSPVSYETDTPSDLRDNRSGADMLIVSYPGFMTDIEPLAERRRSQGLRVRSVSVQDVFDEFSDGEPGPEAIRDFVKYAFEHYEPPAPKYLLLVGDATSDPLDRHGTGTINFMPTYLAYTRYLGETASDLYFVCVAGDDPLPDLMAGRIPARSRAEVASYVQKVLAYEDQPRGGAWEGRFVLAADNATNPSEDVFVPYSNTLAVHASSQIERVTIHLGEYANPAEANTDLKAAIGAGAALVSYVGHSGIFIWADETPSLLNTSDVDSLSNGTELPFAVSFVCLDGFFTVPDASFSCMGERFVLNPSGGAVAAWSPSSITAARDKKVVGDSFARAIFVDDARTPAQAVLPALEAGWAQGLTDIEDVLRTYILFGDPSVRLRIATPVKPAGLELYPGPWNIRLSWDANPEPTVSRYHVFRAEEETGPYVRIATVAQNSFRDSSVTAAETYYYYVTAETDSGYTSSASAPVSGSAEYSSGSGCMPADTAHHGPFIILVAALLALRCVRRERQNTF